MDADLAELIKNMLYVVIAMIIPAVLYAIFDAWHASKERSEDRKEIVHLIKLGIISNIGEEIGQNIETLLSENK